MQLELSDEERDLLREILNGTFRDLNYEIADTDNRTFREQLRERRVNIRRLLDAVGGPLEDAPPA